MLAHVQRTVAYLIVHSPFTQPSMVALSIPIDAMGPMRSFPNLLALQAQQQKQKQPP